MKGILDLSYNLFPKLRRSKSMLTNCGEDGAAKEHGAKESPSVGSLQPYGLEPRPHLGLHFLHNVFVCVGGIV